MNFRLPAINSAPPRELTARPKSVPRIADRSVNPQSRFELLPVNGVSDEWAINRDPTLTARNTAKTALDLLPTRSLPMSRIPALNIVSRYALQLFLTIDFRAHFARF